MEHGLPDARERGQLWLRLGIRAICVAVVLLLVVYAVPPVLSLLLPFVFGLVVAWMLNPAVRWLQRRLSVSRRVISMALIILIFCIIGGALFGLAWAAVREIRSLFENWGAVTEGILGILETVNDWLHSLEHLFPLGLFRVDDLFDGVAAWLQGLDIPGWLTRMTGRVPDVVSGVTGFGISAVVFLMASCFITGDYPRLRFLITDRAPADVREFCGKVKDIFMRAFGGYIRSQLILTLCVFFILMVGFAVTGQPYGLVLATVFAVMDFVPIIGAGTVMIPWAVIDMIIGDYDHAVCFAVIWGLIVVFRRVAEPKILGDQTGLSPILSLIGIYVGMRVGGVVGMIMGPLLILVCINLSKIGVFHPAMADVRKATADVRAILRGGRQEEDRKSF